MCISCVASFFYFFCVAFAQVTVLTTTPVTLLQTSSASFQYPRATETIVLNAIDTVVVQWESNYQTPFLYIWCDYGVPGAPNWRRWDHPQVNTTGKREISPSLYVDMKNTDWTRSYDCHLDLTYEDDYTKAAPSSPHFNVTSFANQATTRTYAYLYTVPPLSPSGVSSAVTMSNTMNALSSPTSNVTNQPAASSNKDTGLSTGATAGIAIGVIIGFVVLALLGFMGWRRRKVDRSPSMALGHNSPMYQNELNSSQSRSKYMDEHQNDPAELEPQREPQELPGSYGVASDHSR